MIPEPSDVLRSHFTFSLGELKTWNFGIVNFSYWQGIRSSDDTDPDTGSFGIIVGFTIKLRELE